MTNTFAAYEIVEIGVCIEENGRDFYNAAFGKSRSRKAKEIFKYLKEEEENHIVDFEDLLDAVHKYEPKETYPEEYFAYMRSLAREHIFTKANKGKEAARSIKSDMDAVELGKKFEKDSIVFYKGMKRIVKRSEHRIIDRLIIEERKHLARLNSLGKTLG